MGSLVTDTGNDAEHIKNLEIAQTECNTAEVVVVTIVEKVVLRSMIEGTAGEPETIVWIAVDGLSDVSGATQLTFTEVAVANVVMNAEIVARVVTTAAIVQSFPVEMIGIKKMKVAESSMIGRIMEIG